MPSFRFRSVIYKKTCPCSRYMPPPRLSEPGTLPEAHNANMVTFSVWLLIPNSCVNCTFIVH